MDYEQQNFQDDEILYAEQLNRIEKGLADICKRLGIPITQSAYDSLVEAGTVREDALYLIVREVE